MSGNSEGTCALCAVTEVRATGLAQELHDERQTVAHLRAQVDRLQTELRECQEHCRRKGEALAREIVARKKLEPIARRVVAALKPNADGAIVPPSIQDVQALAAALDSTTAGADLLKERNRYRAALEQIADNHAEDEIPAYGSVPVGLGFEGMIEVAKAALDGDSND